MKARYWSIVVVLLLINYLIFATIITRLMEYDAQLRRSAPSIIQPTFTPAPVETNYLLDPAVTPRIPTPTPPPEPESVDEFMGVVVRSGPGDHYEVVATLNESASLPVMGRTADFTWWQIEIDGTVGWVSSEVVQINNAESVPIVE